mmetsp:Transcript_54675/g.90627  ORF Transcript_54675/g.90627 Transcript_54675/m.90627 type:complete len:177 (-) Transcript_54675:235-765(-)
MTQAQHRVRKKKVARSWQAFSPAAFSSCKGSFLPELARRVFLFGFVAASQPALLHHWAVHYRDLGVDLTGNLTLVLDVGEAEHRVDDALVAMSQQVLRSLGVPKHRILLASSWSSSVKLEVLHSTILPSLPDDTLLIYADGDEFFEYPCNLSTMVTGRRHQRSSCTLCTTWPRTRI